MTIYLYSGTPGSGKSLHMARDIWYRAKNGKPVICNFDVRADLCDNGKNIHVAYNDALTPEYLTQFAREYFLSHPFREGVIKVFIDESQLLFNAREWNSAGRKEWLQFFTQHRKYGMDIILVAQFDKMLDKQIRSLIEYEYLHRKLTNIGLWGYLFSLVTLGGQFLCVKMWYSQKQRVGREFIRPLKRYTAIYDTYALFDGMQQLDTVQVSQNPNESLAERFRRFLPKPLCKAEQAQAR